MTSFDVFPINPSTKYGTSFNTISSIIVTVTVTPISSSNLGMVSSSLICKDISVCSYIKIFDVSTFVLKLSTHGTGISLKCMYVFLTELAVNSNFYSPASSLILLLIC